MTLSSRPEEAVPEEAVPEEAVPDAAPEAAPEAALEAALQVPAASARLRATLAAGTHPDPAYVDVLVRRCATEPDFSVRDMLTWALTRHDRSATVERLLPELGSPVGQARSQALHTLSKIGDPGAWPAIVVGLLRDADDEVARTAWRTAAGLVPDGERAALAATLATQFGRGDRGVRRSLSRALAVLGDAAGPVVERATADPEPVVRAHAVATARLLRDPDDVDDAVDDALDDALDEARRVVALRGAPLVGE